MVQKNFLGPKNLLVPKTFGSKYLAWKYLWVQKNVVFKKNRDSRILDPKKFCPKISFQKIKVPKNLSVQKIFCVRKSLYQNKRSLHKLSSPKVGSTKLGQNQGSNSWDIADVDKYHYYMCCLDKCPLESWHLLQIVQGTLPLMRIWTNVARTNVAWTNVTVIDGICSRCSLRLKSDQNRVSNSWDIAA